MRAGGKALTLLGSPRTFLILRCLSGGPRGQRELRRAAGSVAPSTLRSQLGALEAAGMTVKQKRDGFPGTLEFELTDGGRALLSVADRLEDWLAVAPGGPLSPGEDQARAAIKGLVDSWTTTVLDALAGGPLSLTELDKRISAASYPRIERCLDTLRVAELIDARTRAGSGTPYAATDWLRHGLGPLVVAARWEHRHAVDGADPVTRADVETALRTVAPLLDLPGDLSGACQLAATFPTGGRRRRVLATLELRSGSAHTGAAHPWADADAWALGPIEAWFSALVDRDADGLKLSGDRRLVSIVLSRLHRAAFEAPASVPAESLQKT